MNLSERSCSGDVMSFQSNSSNVFASQQPVTGSKMQFDDVMTLTTVAQHCPHLFTELAHCWTARAV